MPNKTIQLDEPALEGQTLTLKMYDGTTLVQNTLATTTATTGRFTWTVGAAVTAKEYQIRVYIGSFMAGAYYVYFEDGDVEGTYRVYNFSRAEIVEPVISSSSANVTILPNVVRQAELQQGSKIKAWVRQGSPVFGSVYDSANNPVDLSAFTGIKFTATTANGAELLVVASDDIEITGTDNNTFHFDPPVELVERARVLQWSIRDEADDELISSGTLEIVFAP